MRLDVLLGDLDALLQGPYVYVVRSYVRRQGDEGVVVVGDARKEACVCRFDVPPELAPEVDLPVAAYPYLVLPVRYKAAARDGADRRVAAHAVVLEGAGHLLRLRVKLAYGYAELRPCLQDPHPRDAQLEVLPVSGVDQPVEDGVVEDAPPGAIIGRARRDALPVRLVPGGGDRGRGPHVVRPHLRARDGRKEQKNQGGGRGAELLWGGGGRVNVHGGESGADMCGSRKPLPFLLDFTQANAGSQRDPPLFR